MATSAHRRVVEDHQLSHDDGSEVLSCRRLTSWGVAALFTIPLVVLPAQRADAVVGGGGSCTDSGQTVNCGAGAGGQPGSGGGDGAGATLTRAAAERARRLSAPTSCPTQLPFRAAAMGVRPRLGRHSPEPGT